MRRVGERQHGRGIKRTQPIVHAQRAAACELRAAQQPVRGQYVAELPPGAGDVIFLAGLDDLSAQPRRDAVARLEVQFADPRRRRRAINLDDQRVFVAVDRRRDDRVGIARQQQVGRAVEQHCQAGLKRCGSRRLTRGQTVGIERPQRSVEPGDGSCVVHVGRYRQGRQASARPAHVERPRAHAFGQRAALQLSRQAFEIGVLAGAETPGVVDRQIDLGAGLPGRLELVLVRRCDRHAEPGEPPHVERRHDRGHVPAVRREMPRAQQPRHGHARIGAGLEGVGERAAGRQYHLRVRPQMRGRQIRQRACRFRRNAQHGQRRAGPHGASIGAFGIEHDEHDPRAQPLADGRRRREEPGQVGPVEFDLREVVRLDADSAVDRVGAYHLARAEPDHVTGPAHRGLVRHRLRDARHGDTDKRRRQRGLRAAKGVGLRDRRREAAAHVREEVVGRVGHQDTSS